MAAIWDVLDTVTKGEPALVEPVTGSVPTRQLPDGVPMAVLVAAGWMKTGMALLTAPLAVAVT